MRRINVLKSSNNYCITIFKTNVHEAKLLPTYALDNKRTKTTISLKNRAEL